MPLCAPLASCLTSVNKGTRVSMDSAIWATSPKYRSRFQHVPSFFELMHYQPPGSCRHMSIRVQKLSWDGGERGVTKEVLMGVTIERVYPLRLPVASLSRPQMACYFMCNSGVGHSCLWYHQSSTSTLCLVHKSLATSCATLA